MCPGFLAGGYHGHFLFYNVSDVSLPTIDVVFCLFFTSTNVSGLEAFLFLFLRVVTLLLRGCPFYYGVAE